MATPDSFYEWGRTEKLTAENLTKRFRDLVNRLKPLEALEVSWQAALTVVKGEVLARSESVIAGLRDQLVAITDLDWLTATSGSRVAFVEGGTASLVIDEQSRALFAPGPFAIVGRIGDPQSYAIVQTVAYDRRGTGQWDTTVVTVVGDLGAPHQDWAIGAVAGSTLVQMSLLAMGNAARDATLAARTAVDTAAAAVASDKLIVGMSKSGALQAAETATTKAAEAKASADRAATFDPSSFYPKAAIDQKLADAASATDTMLSALKGSADTAHDTLGELAALIDANTDALARRHFYGNVRGLR